SELEGSVRIDLLHRRGEWNHGPRCRAERDGAPRRAGKGIISRSSGAGGLLTRARADVERMAFPTSRAQAMKRSTGGTHVRLFTVTIKAGIGGIGSSNGSSLRE